MGPLKARLASRNAHKLAELRDALPGVELELVETDEDYPPEEAETYYENARAKARFGHVATGPDAWVLGEDSGIEVAALGGRPGVRSARYARPGAEANAKLLAELGDAADRRARYVCELVCLSPGGEELRGTGVLEGELAREPRGEGGFGYDPIFVPLGETRTVAELGDDWKRASSHRGRAAAALEAAVARRGGW